MSAKQNASQGTSFWQRLSQAFTAKAHDNLQGELHTSRLARGPFVDRLGELMSPVFFEENDRVFVLNSGGQSPAESLGVVLELNPLLWAETVHVSSLERILALDFGAKTVLAVSLYANPMIDEITHTYETAHTQANDRLSQDAQGVLGAMAKAKGKLLRTMAAGSSSSANHDVGVSQKNGTNRGQLLVKSKVAAGVARTFRVWMSIVMQVGHHDVLQYLAGEKTPAVAQFFLNLQATVASLSQFGLFDHVWDQQDLTTVMRALLNSSATSDQQSVMAGYLSATPHQREQLPECVREAFVWPDTQTTIGKERIAVQMNHSNDAYSGMVKASELVAMSVTGYPARTHIQKLRALVEGSAVIDVPFVMTALVMPTPIEADKATMNLKHARAKQLQWTEIGHFLSDLPERTRDLDIGLKACEDGSGLARVVHALTVYAPAGRGAAAAQLAKNVLSRAGLDAHVDVGLQLMSWMATLPLEATPALMQDFVLAKRTRLITKTAASHMLPVLGQSKGTGHRVGEGQQKPLLMLTTRSGAVFPIDLFANPNGNYNAIVVGTSGSGKSVLAQALVMGVLATGGRVWVFDIGKSYQNCVELVAGQFIDFEAPQNSEEMAQTLCLNPLDMLDDPTEMLDEIAQVLTVMANGNAPMEMTQSEYLKMHILQVVKTCRNQGRTPTISDLNLALMNTKDPGLCDLAVRLMPYCTGGRYAHWFQGPMNVQFDSALVVLEMQALSQKPQLQNAVLLILIMRILKEIRTQPRSEKKLIVIDEAWRMLSGEAGAFIEWACRTLRKYGAGIVCISQSLEDFQTTSTARAVRANADSVFLLRQKPQSVASYTTDASLQELLMGLTTVADGYSEVYVKVGDDAGVVGRFQLDDFSQVAFSTRADVFDAVRAYRAKGLTPVEAITKVQAEQYQRIHGEAVVETRTTSSLTTFSLGGVCDD